MFSREEARQMKKKISLLLVVAMTVISLSACSGKKEDAPADGAGSAQQTEVPDDSPYKLVMVEEPKPSGQGTAAPAADTGAAAADTSDPYKQAAAARRIPTSRPQAAARRIRTSRPQAATRPIRTRLRAAATRPIPTRLRAAATRLIPTRQRAAARLLRLHRRRKLPKSRPVPMFRNPARARSTRSPSRMTAG